MYSQSAYSLFQIARELNHVNIIQLYSVYPACNAYYLVTELACGGELLNDLVSRTTYSESTAREIFSQLLSAIAYLHRLRIVHRVSVTWQRPAPR